MAIKTFKLLDAADQTRVDSIKIGPEQVGGKATGYQVTKSTLVGGLSDGVDVIRVDNGAFSFTIVPTRGMGVWKAWHGKELLGWNSPVPGPVHPKYVPVSEPGGLGWLDGFDELFVRCGLESNGAPEFDEETGRLKFPLHGRIANKPAQSVVVSVDDESGEVTVTGVVAEIRFHFLKLRMTSTYKTKPGEPGFRVRDEIENLSASPAEMQMLYHVNFGDTLLDAGARFVAPLKTVVPRNPHAATGIKTWDSYGAPEPAFAEQVYFLELLGDATGRTRSLLKNAHGTRGVSLVYNVKQLPCYSLWKNTTAAIDGTVTGLEPGTNFPNPRSFEGEHGRVAKLPPGGKIAYDVALESHATPGAVMAAERDIAAIQGNQKPTIHDQPLDDWCSK
ncbi:MAG TPA: aldose 1-epimerase family protein [Pirellulaceae bacterium]|nr:aldose 1-epimerase family protein [Pirellulaceae bacterium]